MTSHSPAQLPSHRTDAPSGNDPLTHGESDLPRAPHLMRMAGAAYITAGTLLTVLAIVAPPHDGDERAEVASIAAHPLRAQIATVVFLFAAASLVLACISAASLPRRRGSLTARLGAVLAAPGLLAYTVLACPLRLVTAATTVDVDVLAGIEHATGAALLTYLAAGLIGTIGGVALTLLGLWRAGLAPLWASGLWMAGVLAAQAGSFVVATAGALLTLIALGSPGVRLLRLATTQRTLAN